MRATIKYEIEYPELMDFVRQVQLRLEKGSNLIEAVKTAGKYAVQEWITTANTKFRHSQGGYVKGIIEGVRYPFEGDPLTVSIENEVPYAVYLERGYEPFDLKKMLQTSAKVRVGKDGKRYLIIPFRHGNPSSSAVRPMPAEIYKQAKDLRHSAVASTFRQGVSQRFTKIENPIPIEKIGEYVKDAEALTRSNPVKIQRQKYVWGEKLKGVGGIYENMYRFSKNVNTTREEITQNTSLGKFTVSRMVNKTDNNKAYSHYITFRVMSEDSSGWIHKGLSAMNILKDTKERIEQPVVQLLKDGVKQDLVELGFNA